MWRFERHRRSNAIAEPGPLSDIIVLDRLKPDFNVGKIFRSADAFGVREIHLIGVEFFDVAPAMGGFKWVPAKFFQNFDACYQELKEKGYEIFALEAEGGIALGETELPKQSAFVFGHEQQGLSFDRKRYSDIETITIEQLGRVESLNVSVAASILMYEYAKQYCKSD